MQEVYVNNVGQEMVVIKSFTKRIKTKTWKKCLVQFTATGSVREVYLDNLVDGKVKDLYAPSFCGVGYLGEFERNSYWREAKLLWTNMMKRCYDPKYIDGYFHTKKTTVDAHWLCFANFLADLPKLRNFDKWLQYRETKTGVQYNLDKDLQENSCNIYSLHTCAFETEFLNKGAARRGFKKIDGVFVAPTP